MPMLLEAGTTWQRYNAFDLVRVCRETMLGKQPQVQPEDPGG